MIIRVCFKNLYNTTFVFYNLDLFHLLRLYLFSLLRTPRTPPHPHLHTCAILISLKTSAHNSASDSHSSDPRRRGRRNPHKRLGRQRSGQVITRRPRRQVNLDSRTALTTGWSDGERNDGKKISWHILFVFLDTLNLLPTCIALSVSVSNLLATETVHNSAFHSLIRFLTAIADVQK